MKMGIEVLVLLKHNEVETEQNELEHEEDEMKNFNESSSIWKIH
jgi:hypothetical protein